MKNKTIAIFNKKQIRRHWDKDKELWLFSIIDIIAILTESPRPRKYWNDLKIKLYDKGSEVYEEIGRLKIQAPEYNKG